MIKSERVRQAQQKPDPVLDNLVNVADNKPDLSQCSIKVLHRAEKKGLIPAILEGISYSKGRYILVMDADFSHSPERIPEMVAELEDSGIDMVVASRYMKGGSIIGWPLKTAVD